MLTELKPNVIFHCLLFMLFFVVVAVLFVCLCTETSKSAFVTAKGASPLKTCFVQQAEEVKVKT